MADTPELIQRLRHRAKFDTAESPYKLLNEAADALASIAGENQELREALEQARAGRALLSSQGSDTGMLYMLAQERADAAEARAEAAERDLAEAREALAKIEKWGTVAGMHEQDRDGRLREIARAALSSRKGT